MKESILYWCSFAVLSACFLVWVRITFDILHAIPQPNPNRFSIYADDGLEVAGCYQSEANARAIAALPDLLETLEILYDASNDPKLTLEELRTAVGYFAKNALQQAGYTP